MASTPISPVVRDILRSDLDLSADEVIEKAQARGVTASAASIRTVVHNIKSDLRKAAARKAKPAPAAARQTLPKATPTATLPTPLSSPAPKVSAVFANVALVNQVVGAAGGVEEARKVAEAVRTCGGVEAFLQHLDLVAAIRAGGPAA